MTSLTSLLTSLTTLLTSVINSLTTVLMFQEMKVKAEDAEMKDVTNTGEKEVPTWLSKVSSE